MSAGYSATPLIKKLGFKPGWRVAVLNAPQDYFDLLPGAEEVSFVTDLEPDLNAVHLFLHAPEGVASQAQSAIAQLATGGMLWMSWAKKSSPLNNGVTEDLLRDQILPLGWVDVKVCAVSADWSGLKFLRRRAS